MVLTNSYHFINFLLDPISEAHDQLIELGSLSSAPPGAGSNDNGEPVLFLHCFKRSEQCENESGSWERVDNAMYTMTYPLTQRYIHQTAP